MVPNPEISVIVPALNEQECVKDCVSEIRTVLTQAGKTFEIIVVDDGSTDGTFNVLRRLRRSVRELRVLRFTVNCGQTAAMAAGFAHARADIVAALDADLQNDPADLPGMLAMMSDWDVVCGVRAERADNWLRRLSSRVANDVRNRMTGERITDTGCTLKVFRKELLDRVKLYDGMHRFLPALLRLAGARVTEVPVNHRPRLRGCTKYGVWNRLFRSLRDLFAVRWMMSRWLRYSIEENLE